MIFVKKICKLVKKVCEPKCYGDYSTIYSINKTKICCFNVFSSQLSHVMWNPISFLPLTEEPISAVHVL